MKSHFYKVQATHKELTYWKRTWLFHSFLEIKSFNEHAEGVMNEWDIFDICEISFGELEIIDHWDSE